jgi:hypothetical protein
MLPDIPDSRMVPCLISENSLHDLVIHLEVLGPLLDIDDRLAELVDRAKKDGHAVVKVHRVDYLGQFPPIVGHPVNPVE